MGEIRLLTSSANFAAGREDHPRWPSEVFLENLQAESRGLMQLDVFDANLRAILEHANVVHAFGYGEPTIHPNFRLLLQQLGEYGVWVDFFTHGMHLDRELCEFLVEHRIGQITISFSGVDQGEYEDVYIGGDFRRVVAGIQRLRDTKLARRSRWPEIHINSIAFKHHVEKLPEFVSMMADAGVDCINLRPLDTYDSIPELHQHAWFASEDGADYLARAQALARHRGVILRISPETATPSVAGREALDERHKGEVVNEQVVTITDIGRRARDRGRSKDYQRPPNAAASRDASRKVLDARDETVELPPGQPSCLEPYNTFYADLNGRVKPCCFASGEALYLGQLREQPGSEIWHSAPFKHLRESVAQKRYPGKMCAMCLKSDSYPRLPPHPGLVILLALFSGRYLSLIPWRFIVPVSAGLFARLLRTPTRARFLNRVNRALLWVGLQRRAGR